MMFRRVDGDIGPKRVTMNLGDENTGEVIDENLLETGGCHPFHHQQPSSRQLFHYQKPGNNNHHYYHWCRKNFIKITLLFVAAAVSCLILYHSTSYKFENYFLSSYHPLHTSDGQSRHGNHSSFHDEHTQRNISTPASPPASVNGNSSFSAPSDDLSPRNLSSPTDSRQGNLSFSAPSDDSSPVDMSSPTDSVQGNLSSPVVQENGENELEKVLNRAAMENKTVILTTLNSAWIAPHSIFDLFLESFKIGNQTKALLNHLVVVALDKKAYSHCLELHPHCYTLTTEGVDFSGEAHFMTTDYLKMMWRRIDFLRTVLEMGYSFIFTDADVMWFRNPFTHFYSDTDFQIACDHYWYASTDLDNSPNGGFNYVQSNNRTIQFYTFWYNSKNKYPGKHDQDVLNMIKYDPFIKEIGLSIQFLDTAYFGGFCEPSKDLNKVCTMHANCCIGLENKIHDLTMLIEDWRNYTAMPNELKTLDPPPSWTVPRICG